MSKSKLRSVYTMYHIVSYMFKESASSTLSMYTTGNIMYVGGANCFEITRAQASYILQQSRSRDFHCTVRKSTMPHTEIIRGKVVDYR